VLLGPDENEAKYSHSLLDEYAKPFGLLEETVTDAGTAANTREFQVLDGERVTAMIRPPDWLDCCWVIPKNTSL
jgi:hypothetical protein